MRAGQKLVASDGYEVALFPLEVLKMSQDEGGDFSHIGTYNIDFVGLDIRTPIYAPCSCTCVELYNSYTSGNLRFFQGDNLVHTPLGLRKLLFFFAHDANPVATYVGQHFNQGDLIGHTGQYGYATGDHTHTCMGLAPWISYSVSMTERPPENHVDLTNRIHYWDAVYVNDTRIIQGFNHNWRTWSGPIPPTPTKEKSHFPWILYMKELREKMSS